MILTFRVCGPRALHYSRFTPARCKSKPHHEPRIRHFSSFPQRLSDPRIEDLGPEITDTFSALRASYSMPRHPIVLAHGLLGFNELTPIPFLPSIQYWHGIKDALEGQGARVLCAEVPPSSSIEDRARKLKGDIEGAFGSQEGQKVNVIAHSMGGLDSRYMISRDTPKGVDVASLVTVATPHRGSYFADILLDEAGGGPIHLPKLYGLISSLGLGTEAFSQLTQTYLSQNFNPSVPDVPSTSYYSYGATCSIPPLLSPFRQSWKVLEEKEGKNDGLVSVSSSRWGEYKGTLVGVSHLDLINWSNEIRWRFREVMGMRRLFNAVAFYLGVADMLAKEGH